MMAFALAGGELLRFAAKANEAWLELPVVFGSASSGGPFFRAPRMGIDFECAPKGGCRVRGATGSGLVAFDPGAGHGEHKIPVPFPTRFQEGSGAVARGVSVAKRRVPHRATARTTLPFRTEPIRREQPRYS